MIRVLLVDDQTLVRQGIRGLLAFTIDIEVVGEAADANEALQQVSALEPDVMLLDVRMPGLSGIEVLKALRARDRLPGTILLTTFDDDESLLSGMRAGAQGFLLKDISLEQLADAIRKVASGLTLIRPAITERVTRHVRDASPGFPTLDRPESLTEREAEVLRLMAGGFNNREIADALGTREGTVKNHVSNVLSKLGVRDRVRAVLRGIDLGYL